MGRVKLNYYCIELNYGQLHLVKQTTCLDYAVMAARLAELEVNDVNTTQLLTAALGLTAEVW